MSHLQRSHGARSDSLSAGAQVAGAQVAGALAVVVAIALLVLMAGQPTAAADAPSAVRAASAPVPAGAALPPAAPTVSPPPIPVATANPGVPPAASVTGSDGCGLLDVPCQLTGAINGWFRGLVSSALNPVLDLLGRSVLTTPQVTGPGRVAELWAVSVGIANGLFVLFLVLGGMVVMGHETVQTRYSLKDIAPRLVVAGIAANTSLALAGGAISLANGLSAAFLGGGVDPAAASAALGSLLVAPLAGGGMFLTLLGLVSAILGVALLAVYVLRIALVVVLIAAAPVMLACHALPQTDALARLWWRAFTGALVVQVAQSLVLITALRVFLTPTGPGLLGLPSSGGLVDVLVAACLLYLLLLIPSWVTRLALSGGHRSGGTLRTIQSAVVYKSVRAATAGR